uniref:Uncharacterized protein n=1 Tax=Moumouvirus sp. 'Monve' TaxID=1128131 RepID=H2EET2_9VIRU|nr:hypothetical protein mv_L700 [Moumouvirus Monve]
MNFKLSIFFGQTSRSNKN